MTQNIDLAPALRIRGSLSARCPECDQLVLVKASAAITPRLYGHLAPKGAASVNGWCPGSSRRVAVSTEH